MKQAGASNSVFVRGIALAMACCLSAAMLCGCASVAANLAGQLVVDAALATAGVPRATWKARPEDLAVVGMDGSPIDYPISAVYRGLVEVSDAAGLKVVAADDAAYTLRVSYPFSLAQNNWGGEITVKCVQDAYGTRVLFEDDGHDTPFRVKKLEARLLDDTLKWLQQQSHG
jgi:hypothetical protein